MLENMGAYYTNIIRSFIQTIVVKKNGGSESSLIKIKICRLKHALMRENEPLEDFFDFTLLKRYLTNDVNHLFSF